VLDSKDTDGKIEVVDVAGDEVDDNSYVEYDSEDVGV
jgi:hypothetical protein